MSNKRKRPNLAVRMLLTAIMLAASVYFIVNICNEASITISLFSDRVQAKNQLEELQQEKDKLNDQKAKLNDKNYVENYARGEYMITKDGESIYHLPARSEDQK